MRASHTLGQNPPQDHAIVPGALTALCKTWTAYTLKRAIADVASMSDEDYRGFGLDKAEILTALRRLAEEIEDAGTFGPNSIGSQLAIVVTRREPRRLVSS